MPDGGFCNDLAQDTRGNLYVTDSRHPRVLRLSPGASALEVWKEDAALGGERAFPGYPGLNGIAIDGDREIYVSLVAASDHLLRIALDADGTAGSVTRVHASRTLKNVDAIRSWKPGRLVLFESNAFGDAPYGGQMTLARVDGDHMGLQPVVSGLNDASSGVVWHDRVYFIESKYGLLMRYTPEGHAPPKGVPFDLQSRALPRDIESGEEPSPDAPAAAAK